MGLRGQIIDLVGLYFLYDAHERTGIGHVAVMERKFILPLHVFDQKKNAWFTWNKLEWIERKKGDEPVIAHAHIAGGGTRFLEENGKRAIKDLFQKSFA